MDQNSDIVVQKVTQDEQPLKSIAAGDATKTCLAAVDATRTFLDEMKPKDRISTAVLTAKVAEKLGITISKALPFVSIAIIAYEGITVDRGRYGGIYKGIREKKVELRSKCSACNQFMRKKRSPNRPKSGSVANTEAQQASELHDSESLEVNFDQSTMDNLEEDAQDTELEDETC